MDNEGSINTGTHNILCLPTMRSPQRGGESRRSARRPRRSKVRRLLRRKDLHRLEFDKSSAAAARWWDSEVSVCPVIF